MRVVMKFGGSILDSVEDFERIVEMIKGRNSEEIIIVLSALNGTTDSIIEATDNALDEQGTIAEFMGAIEKRHLDIAAGIKNNKIREETEGKINSKLKVLERALYGINYLRECPPRIRDFVHVFGERLAVILLEGLLLDSGVKAKGFGSDEVGILTDGNFGKATPIMAEVEKNLKKNVEPLLKENVVIITGFFGVDKQGNTTSFGRGGSDFLAGIVAAAMNTDALELWKDVDGFMTADPKIVENAKLIRHLSYNEAEELGYFGAKIFHPRTATPIRGRGIKIMIKNILKPKAQGTTISSKSNINSEVVKSVAAKSNIALITIRSPEIVGVPGMLTMIFSALSEKGISVDVVSTSEAAVSLTIDKEDLEAAKKALENLEMEIEKISFDSDVGLIGIIGEGMRNTPEIAGRLFSCLGKEGINVEMISQGASEINISFVIKSKGVGKVIKKIHEEFMG